MVPPDDERDDAELLRHAAWIRRLAVGLAGGDAASAEDLVQDAWVAALRRRPSGDRTLRPWLATVLRNAARQAFRGAGRRQRREAEAARPEAGPAPEELLERLELERRLTDELARLEEPFRQTLWLRYYEGLEPAEIARRLGVPAGTVRWRAKRGLERLRERLDRGFGGRAQWGALLLPFTRPTEATLKGAAAAAVPGALAMHAMTKLGIGAAAAVAVMVGLRLAGALPDALWPLASERPADVSLRPFVPRRALEPARVESVARAAAPGAGVRRAVVPAGAVEPDAAAPTPAATVEARAVDAYGTVLVEARLAFADAGVVARADASGTLRLALPGGFASEDEPRPAFLALEAPGFASRGLDALVRAGETTHLGTIELARGGAVSGSVRAVDGRPLEGVRITFGELDLPRQELEVRRLHPAERGVPAGATDAAGAFLVEGVPEGWTRVWAHAEGYLASYSAPVEVRAGQESYGLELALEEVPDSNRIAGVVLDPEGRPVPRAELGYGHASERTGTSVSGSDACDAEGRFAFLLPEDAVLWIRATDPEERYGPASAADVRTGGGELVLRLSRPAELALRAVDPQGRPVPRYHAAVVTGEERGGGEARGPRAEHEDGRTSLRVPSGPFSVLVDAPGFALERVGPLAPEALPELLAVELRPLPGLAGRVWSDGEPLAGAEVSLQREVPSDRIHERNGFRTLVEGALETVPTDEDGRFLLTPRAPGRYVVRAEAEGLAPAVAGPIELGADLAAGEVDLVLGRGGAIEGRVVTPDGSDPTGTIVGLSRGDGSDRTVRVGPDGAFRFEGLTPGPWLVCSRDEEIRPWTTTTSTTDARRPPPIEWSCEVVEGRTTWFDLVLGDAYELAGRLTIDGRGPAGWGATLLPEDEFFASEGGDEVPLDPGGGFRVHAASPGRYWLVLSGYPEDGPEQFVLDLVELDAGSAPWDLDLATGSLRVEGVPTWSGDGPPSYVHVWDGPGRRRVVTLLAGDELGVARAASAPAGSGRIVRPVEGRLDLDAWPTVLEVTVPRGGEARAALP